MNLTESFAREISINWWRRGLSKLLKISVCHTIWHVLCSSRIHGIEKMLSRLSQQILNTSKQLLRSTKKRKKQTQQQLQMKNSYVQFATMSMKPKIRFKYLNAIAMHAKIVSRTTVPQRLKMVQTQFSLNACPVILFFPRIFSNNYWPRKNSQSTKDFWGRLSSTYALHSSIVQLKIAI